jgi:hypothetical protein
MASNLKSKPNAASALLRPPFNATVQIGPFTNTVISGELIGFYFASSVTFYVQVVQGDPSQNYVFFAPSDHSADWAGIANNQVVTVGVQAPVIVEWLIAVPPGVSIILMMGP